MQNWGCKLDATTDPEREGPSVSFDPDLGEDSEAEEEVELGQL